MAKPQHPLPIWSRACASPYVLGFTLIGGGVEVPDREGLPSVTIVHPTLGLRTPVAGGGPEAWEPLRPPASECPPSPPHFALAAGAWNPNLHPAEAAVPGAGGWSVVRAPPLGLLGIVGEAGRPEGVGWVECRECASADGRVYFVGDAILFTACAQHDVYLLHPAGFVYVGSDAPAHGAAVVLDCPRGPYFAASPWSVSVHTERGAAKVRAGGLAVLGRGGFLEAARALASLVLEPGPPREAPPGLSVRCSGRPCRVTAVRDGAVELGLWNPVKDPVVVEVVPRFRPSGALVVDPVGEVDIPVERGLVRVTVPGYSWAKLVIEKKRSLAEEVRKRLAPRRG